MNIKIWQLVILIVILFIVALLVLGQAMLFIWLSAFPENAFRLEVLTIKTYVCFTLFVFLIGIDVELFLHLIERLNKKN